MTIFEKIAFVLSIIIYKILGFVNEPIDFLTKILLFQNIYYIILFIMIFLIKFFFIKSKKI
jgi:hypothetical protein